MIETCEEREKEEVKHEMIIALTVSGILLHMLLTAMPEREDAWPGAPT
jgi:hypothetical protein